MDRANLGISPYSKRLNDHNFSPADRWRDIMAGKPDRWEGILHGAHMKHRAVRVIQTTLPSSQPNLSHGILYVKSLTTC